MQSALGAHDLIPLTKEKLDITDFVQVQTVAKELRPDCILNAAAYTNVDGAEMNVRLAYAVNALGPRNLAVIAATLDIPLMHVSTDYVFDGRSSVPYHEFDRTNPLSAYGASKLAGEEAIRSLHRRHFIARTAWQGQATWYELSCELYRRLGIATPVEPAKSSEFPRPAPRPRFAALTTIQSPCIRLPVWQEGVAEYASCILAVKPNVHSAI